MVLSHLKKTAILSGSCRFVMGILGPDGKRMICSDVRQQKPGLKMNTAMYLMSVSQNISNSADLPTTR